MLHPAIPLLPALLLALLMPPLLLPTPLPPLLLPVHVLLVLQRPQA